MEFPTVTIKAVAMAMLVLHLLLPPFVHAHGFALVESDRPPTLDVVCFAVDADASHDPSGSHQHAVGVCHSDMPFLITDFQAHTVKPFLIKLASPYTGRMLPGYARPIDIPPRLTAFPDSCDLSRKTIRA